MASTTTATTVVASTKLTPHPSWGSLDDDLVGADCSCYWACSSIDLSGGCRYENLLRKSTEVQTDDVLAVGATMLRWTTPMLRLDAASVAAQLFVDELSL